MSLVYFYLFMPMIYMPTATARRSLRIRGIRAVKKNAEER